MGYKCGFGEIVIEVGYILLLVGLVSGLFMLVKFNIQFSDGCGLVIVYNGFVVIFDISVDEGIWQIDIVVMFLKLFCIGVVNDLFIVGDQIGVNVNSWGVDFILMNFYYNGV